MNTNTVIKTKLFWAWQDEKEEAWLSEKAREGLHLESIPFPVRYKFQKGEPANYVYRLDYQSLKSKDRESYLQLFEDAGWEHVADMGGWIYFRIITNDGEAPEIYSDTESKMRKYQRIMIILVIFLPILISIRPYTPDQSGPFSIILSSLFAILFLLYAFAMVQLLRRMDQIKKKG